MDEQLRNENRKIKDIRYLLYQLLNKDNWETIDSIDSFLFIYDKMPDRMRIIVDLRMSGYSRIEISNILHIAIGTINCQLYRAKRRLMESIL